MKGLQSDGRQRRISRPIGCLLWLIAFVVLLLVLAELFGGFQKGTKVQGATAVTAVLAA